MYDSYGAVYTFTFRHADCSVREQTLLGQVAAVRTSEEER
jgi:hypothetical protein